MYTILTLKDSPCSCSQIADLGANRKKQPIKKVKGLPPEKAKEMREKYDRPDPDAWKTWALIGGAALLAGGLVYYFYIKQ